MAIFNSYVRLPEGKQSHFDVLEGTIVVNPEMRQGFVSSAGFFGSESSLKSVERLQD